MDPGGGIALQHGRDKGGAGRIEHSAVTGVPDDLVVCGQQRSGQEVGHTLQHRPRLALEQSRYGLQGHLCGHFALGVPPHAVGQQKQPGLAGVAIPHAVFIARTSATPTDLEDRKFHFGLAPMPVACCTFFLASDTMVSNCRRTFSPTDSLV